MARLRAVSLNPSVQIRAVPTLSTGRGVAQFLNLGHNPSIHIRAIPTNDYWGCIDWCIDGSQSLNTYQGNSDFYRRLSYAETRRKSQSLSTDQGSSDFLILCLTLMLWPKKSQSLSTDQGSSDVSLSAGPLGTIQQTEVSIPQYRSGQFRRQHGRGADQGLG